MFSWLSNLWGNFVESVKNPPKPKNNSSVVQVLKKDGAVNPGVTLVLADASQYHVAITLPSAKTFVGHHLVVVCADASHGIEILLNDSDIIFDSSNSQFNAKGDAITLVNDSESGTWYIVGRYAAQWYA